MGRSVGVSCILGVWAILECMVYSLRVCVPPSLRMARHIRVSASCPPRLGNVSEAEEELVSDSRIGESTGGSDARRGAHGAHARHHRTPGEVRWPTERLTTGGPCPSTELRSSSCAYRAQVELVRARRTSRACQQTAAPPQPSGFGEVKHKHSRLIVTLVCLCVRLYVDHTIGPIL